MPIVPICISCLTSYLIIKLNTRKKITRSTNTTHSVTITIVIFTVVYIIFNIPVFINYLLMTIAGMSNGCRNNCYSIKYKDNFVLLWFSWNFTYVMCVGLNAMFNPVIYYLRMKNVKEYIDDTIRKSSRIMLEMSQNARRRISTERQRLYSSVSKRSLRTDHSSGSLNPSPYTTNYTYQPTTKV